MKNINNNMLPSNTPGIDSPVIPVDYPITTPISVVVKKRTFNFQTAPDSLPSNVEENQEIDAKKFPIMKDI